MLVGGGRRREQLELRERVDVVPARGETFIPPSVLAAPHAAVEAAEVRGLLGRVVEPRGGPSKLVGEAKGGVPEVVGARGRSWELLGAHGSS